jgi:hypothetical protein
MTLMHFVCFVVLFSAPGTRRTQRFKRIILRLSREANQAIFPDSADSGARYNSEVCALKGDPGVGLPATQFRPADIADSGLSGEWVCWLGGKRKNCEELA